MGVTIKSMNGLVAIKKLGIDAEAFEWLMSSGLEVKLTSKAFEFLHPDNNPPAILAAVEVTLTQLQELNKGVLSTVETKLLQQKIELTCAELAEYLELNPVQTKPSGALGLLSAKNLSKAVEAQAQPEPKAPAPKAAVQIGGWPIFDISKLKTAHKVKLRDAKQLYQPVSGSSGGSRYFVVAGGSGIAVAARYNNGQLSIRVEGENFGEHAGALHKAGLPPKGDDYSSIHLSVNDDMIARKALGAILMAICVDLETPFPNLMVIKNVK